MFSLRGFNSCNQHKDNAGTSQHVYIFALIQTCMDYFFICFNTLLTFLCVFSELAVVCNFVWTKVGSAVVGSFLLQKLMRLFTQWALKSQRRFFWKTRNFSHNAAPLQILVILMQLSFFPSNNSVMSKDCQQSKMLDTERNQPCGRNLIFFNLMLFQC